MDHPSAPPSGPQEQSANEAPQATPPAHQTFTIGTRSSQLAMLQTSIVTTALHAAHPTTTFAIESMQTLGDKDKQTPLHQFNAKALWTHELEALLIAGTLDMIVHSMKDVPTQLPVECQLGAILQREDPRDAVVMRRFDPDTSSSRLKPNPTWQSLADLPPGTLVGTGSVRRQAQIASRYPHLRFRDVRGNVPTRLEKLDRPEKHGIAAGDQVACTILAVAGLKRLGLEERVTQYLSSDKESGAGCLHAVGQGAIAIETRLGDERTLELLRTLDHAPTSLACLAERSLMRTLEGGCSVPIGVETQWVDKGSLKMIGRVVALDGSRDALRTLTAPVTSPKEAGEFGLKMARALIEEGAQEILKEINLNRAIINA